MKKSKLIALLAICSMSAVIAASCANPFASGYESSESASSISTSSSVKDSSSSKKDSSSSKKDSSSSKDNSTNSSVSTPDSSVSTPDSSVSVPDSSVSVPDSSVSTPDSSVSTPDSSVEDSSSSPDDSSSSPDDSSSSGGGDEWVDGEYAVKITPNANVNEYIPLISNEAYPAGSIVTFKYYIAGTSAQWWGLAWNTVAENANLYHAAGINENYQGHQELNKDALGEWVTATVTLPNDGNSYYIYFGHNVGGFTMEDGSDGYILIDDITVNGETETFNKGWNDCTFSTKATEAEVTFGEGYVAPEFVEGEYAVRIDFDTNDHEYVPLLSKEAYPGGTTISFKYRFEGNANSANWWGIAWHTDVSMADIYHAAGIHEVMGYKSFASSKPTTWTTGVVTLPDDGNNYYIYVGGNVGGWDGGLLIDNITVNGVTETFNKGFENSAFWTMATEAQIGLGDGYVPTYQGNLGAKINLNDISGTKSTPSFITSIPYAGGGTVTFDYYMYNPNNTWWAFGWTTDDKDANIYAFNSNGNTTETNNGQELPKNVTGTWTSVTVEIPEGNWYFYFGGAKGEWADGYVIIDNFVITNAAGEVIATDSFDYGFEDSLFINNRPACISLVDGKPQQEEPPVVEEPVYVENVIENATGSLTADGSWQNVWGEITFDVPEAGIYGIYAFNSEWNQSDVTFGPQGATDSWNECFSNYMFEVTEAGSVTLATNWFAYAAGTENFTYCVYKVSELTVDKAEGSAELAANLYAPVKIVAPAAGTYLISLSKSVTWFTALNQSADYGIISGTYQFTASAEGEEISLYVMYSDLNYEKFDFEWSIVELPSYDLVEGDNEAVLYSGIYMNVNFTADKTAKYTLTVTADYNVMTGIYGYSEAYDTNTWLEGDWEPTFIFDAVAGETKTLTVYYTGYDADYNAGPATINAIINIAAFEEDDPSNLQVGENVFTATVDGVAASFTAPEAGWYTIEDGYLYSMTFGEETELGYKEVQLAAGETVNFTVNYDGLVTITISTFTPAVDLYEGENTVTVYGNAALNFNIEYNKPYTLTISNDNVVVYINGAAYTPGETFTLEWWTECYIATNDGNTAEATITVTKFEYPSLVEGDNADVAVSASGTTYQFTAGNEPATYTFTIVGAINNASIGADKAIDYPDALNAEGAISINVKAGAVIELFLQADEDTTVAINVAKTSTVNSLEASVAMDDTGMNPASLTIASLKDGAVAYYAASRMMGDYTITWDAEAYGNIIVYAGDNVGMSYDPQVRLTRTMMDGVVYLMVRNNSGADLENVVLNFAVYEEPVVELEPQGQVVNVNEETTIEIGSWQDVIFSFVAPATGSYTLKTESSIMVDLWLYNENWGAYDRAWTNVIDSENGGEYTFDLEEGEIINFWAMEYDMGAVSFVFTISDGNSGSEEPPVGETTTLVVETTDTYGWFDLYTITASAASTYTITLPAGLGLYSKANYDAYAAPEMDFYDNVNGATVTVDLAAGEEFAFYVGALTKGTWTIEYSVGGSEEPPVEVDPLVLVVGDNVISVADSDLGGAIAGTFTVEVEGNYAFTSNDLMVVIYDEYGMQIGRNYAYLVPGTYNVDVVTAFVSTAGDYSVSVALDLGEEVGGEYAVQITPNANGNEYIPLISNEAYPAGSIISFKYYIAGASAQWWGIAWNTVAENANLYHAAGINANYQGHKELSKEVLGEWVTATVILPNDGNSYYIYFGHNVGGFTMEDGSDGYILIDDITVNGETETFNKGWNDCTFSTKATEAEVTFGEGYVAPEFVEGEYAVRIDFDTNDHEYVPLLSKEAYPGGTTITFKYRFEGEANSANWWGIAWHTDVTKANIYHAAGIHETMGFKSFANSKPTTWTTGAVTLPDDGNNYYIYVGGNVGGWNGGLLIDNITVNGKTETFNKGLENSAFWTMATANEISLGEGYVPTKVGDMGAKININTISEQNTSFITAITYAGGGTVSFDYYMYNPSNNWWSLCWGTQSGNSTIYAHTGSYEGCGGMLLPKDVAETWTSVTVDIPEGNWYFYIGGAKGSWGDGYVILDNVVITNAAGEVIATDSFDYGFEDSIFVNNRPSSISLVEGKVESETPVEPEEPAHVCTLVYTAAVEPGCHYIGNVEYWTCSECEAVWLDEACTQLSNRKNVILPATGADVVHVEATAPSCYENGNIEYWYCEACEQVWQNEALTQLTNFKNVIVPAACENIIYVEAKAPSCYETGNVEHWYCEVCERVWADEALTQLTNHKNVIVPAACENIIYVEAKAPSCYETGNVEHWYCEVCERVWADEALTQLTNHKNVIVPAACTNLVHMEAVEPACHYSGNIEYWVCYDCERVWADEALTQLTNIKNVILPALGGDVVHVEAVAVTCDANGNIEYWYCEACEQVWQDEALTQLTNRKNVVVPSTGHEYFYPCDPVCMHCYEVTNPDAAHNVVHVEAVDATCQAMGNVEYWYCSYCGTAWTDAELTMQTNVRNVNIPVADHTGYEEDFVCDVCSDVLLPEDGATLTIAQANAIGRLYDHNEYGTNKYYVVGHVKSVYQTTYGNMYLFDENGNEFTVYGSYLEDGTRYDSMADKPVASDYVVIYGAIGNYNGSAQIKNGVLIELVHHTECEWVEATCLQAKHCLWCGASEGTTAEHNYVDGACDVCGAPEGVSMTTATVSIADAADANGWADATRYGVLALDENITVTADPTKGSYNNTGKYYVNGENWRMYQNESPEITVTATEGKTILSVKITYSVSNTGVLTLDGAQVQSNEVVDVNASSITFSVGNTSTKTNGQVRITAIEVIYG